MKITIAIRDSRLRAMIKEVRQNLSRELIRLYNTFLLQMFHIFRWCFIQQRFELVALVKG